MRNFLQFHSKQDLISCRSQNDNLNKKDEWMEICTCVGGRLLVCRWAEASEKEVPHPASPASPASSPNPILTPASLWLIHLFPTFYREEQEKQNKHFWDGVTRGEAGVTGCCLSLRSCFLPFSQGAAVTQVHKQPPVPPVQIRTALPLFGGNSAPHKAFYCCTDFLAALIY